jgi:hypothetical protein
MEEKIIYCMKFMCFPEMFVGFWGLELYNVIFNETDQLESLSGHFFYFTFVVFYVRLFKV